jgi:FKBP-type peptidyl-prolyl cis-trans isomerase
MYGVFQYNGVNMSIAAPNDLNDPPKDAVTTSTGLKYKIITSESEDYSQPSATANVTVHYTGWMTNGSMFDSSVLRGEPTSFPLDGVIKGWTEGVQLMSKGEKARFWIPADLAYGSTPVRPGYPYGDLVFDIELLDFSNPPEIPEDIGSVPENATQSSTGLAYRVLEAGTGNDTPNATSSVTVHYSGWMTNGEMFDSSILRGEPISFSLNQVIPGWTEGLQTMVIGEKKRFWIPGKLAYGDTPSRPGYPYGMLVFDVELLSFK